MSQDDIDQSWKIAATFETVVFPELCTFGVHTGLRVAGAYSAAVTVMQSFLTNLESVLVPVEGRTITIYEWSTVGFTGWHQVASADDTASTYGSGDEMPHQLQAVGTYVNDNEVDVPIGRRRNRSYIGPMNAGTIDNSDGRVGDTLVTNMLNAWETLDDDLTALGGLVPAADFAGLCVVSEAAGLVMDATRVKVGKKYDIHRSRAEKTPESYDVVVL